MIPRISCDSPCSVHCTGATAPLFSPSPELLSSNTAPSDSQKAAISDAVERAKMDLARVHDTIEILFARRTQLEDFIQNHTTVLSSPIRRLPDEMLTEIFTHCMNVDEMFDPFEGSAWVVSRVCQRWCTVATTSPELWCNFVLMPTLSRRLQRFLEMQLHRARFTPLFIRFTGRKAFHADIIDIFLAKSAQWEEVAFYNADNFSRVLNHGASFPRLKKLKVDGWTSILPEDSSNFDIVNSLPALMHFHLDVHFEPIPRQLLLPWSQLRTCVLYNFLISDARWILSLLSPNTAVYLHSGMHDLSNPVVQPILIESKISSLEVHGHGLRADLLNTLVAPALQKLFVGAVHPLTDAQDIVSFLDSSQSSLKHLRIENGTASSVVQILSTSSAHELTRLDLNYITDLPVLFKELGQREGLIPRLQTLVIRGTSQNIENWGIFDTFGLLAHRNPTVHRILSDCWEWNFPKNSSRSMDGTLDIVILEQKVYRQVST